tara:strand:- start:580 stop:804 length:225 start_codon:yes stop_codon:yes gene_type:complete
MSVKRNLVKFRRYKMSASGQVLDTEGVAGGGGNLSGEGNTDLTLGDKNNDGSITIKSTHPQQNNLIETTTDFAK